MKVLIIDDEIDLSLLLKSYFVRKGYEVVLSHTLTDGLAALKTYEPDILFLDNNLPDGTGWTETPAILDIVPDIQLFLISAYHPVVPEVPGHIKVTVLEKPISFSDLDHLFLGSASIATESPEPENL